MFVCWSVDWMVRQSAGLFRNPVGALVTSFVMTVRTLVTSYYAVIVATSASQSIKVCMVISIKLVSSYAYIYLFVSYINMQLHVN